jgi:uncharacterized membrane protein
MRNSLNTTPHRLMGGIWVLAMALSALSSFWLGGGVLPLDVDVEPPSRHLY